MEQKNQKNCLVFRIIPLGPGSTISVILDQETSHWQSICYQGTLKLKISQREKFSKQGSLRAMENMMKVL